MNTASPPSPSSVPLLGHTLEYVRRPLEFRETCAACGDIVHTTSIGYDMYVISHPEHVEQVLVRNATAFEKSDFLQRKVRNTFGRGLFFSDGEFWRKQRELIQPAFYSQQIDEYAGVMCSFARRMADEWHPGQRIDVHTQMERLTLQILVRTLFGIDIKYEDDRLGEAVHAVLSKFEPKNQLIPPWIPTTANRRYKRGLSYFEDKVAAITERANAGDVPDDALLSHLVDATSDGGHQMTERTLRDELMTFLFAGHESTALTMTYVWYLLNRNPEAQKRLLEQIDTLDDDPRCRDDLDRVPYVRKVVKETMRLIPPVHGILRQPTEPVEVGGWKIGADDTLDLNTWAIHRDERWYDDPEQFRPERWTDEFETQLPHCAYLPFGQGPRKCVGHLFSQIEAEIILATIARRYELDRIDTGTIEFDTSLAVRPANGLDVVVRDR